MPIPFPPSVEQQRIIDAYLRGDHLAVLAGAGTGKSATLAFIAQAQLLVKGEGTAWYITFNKANATEVGSTFKKHGLTNGFASTAHSLANRGCRAAPHLRHWVERLNAGTLSRKEEMAVLDIAEAAHVLDSILRREIGTDKVIGVITPAGRAPYRTQCRFHTLTRETVKNFCKSADTEIREKHVPHLPDMHEAVYAKVRTALAESAQRMWQELSDPTSRIGTSHDHYLKAWQLAGPVIGNPGDVLLYDEAQDASPVLADIVLRQRDRIQIAMVGDMNQQIYRFIGSVAAIEDFSERPDVTTLTLTRCRRFGSEIAAEANSVLDRLDPHGRGLRLVGIGPDGGRVQRHYGKADKLTVTAVVARSNALVIAHIIEQSSAGRKVHSTLDVTALKGVAADVELVLAGRPSEARNVVLQGFTDLDLWEAWLDDDAPEYEELRDQVKTVLKYGIEAIRTAAAALVKDPRQADVTVSTIHKAKGGTWDRVLVDMGEMPIDDDDEDQLRLLYVAITRARTLVLWNPPARKPDRGAA